jgi:hypothetical protein
LIATSPPSIWTDLEHTNAISSCCCLLVRGVLNSYHFLLTIAAALRGLLAESKVTTFDRQLHLTSVIAKRGESHRGASPALNTVIPAR